MENPVSDDILLPFEKNNIRAHYRPYYNAKRVNFFANVQDHNEIWNCYMQLDEIWLRILENCQVVSHVEQALPLVLFMNAHAKMRIAMELAFSGCLSEARSILRDAIEFLAHGHRLICKPKLQTLWGDKDTRKKEWDREFLESKKNRLFEGLSELHKNWGELSDLGSHANMNALIGRLVIIDSKGERVLNLKYFGGETDKFWALPTFALLLVCSVMEKTFFKDFQARLHLDDVLLKRRSAFEATKETLRKTLIAKYNINPPIRP